MSTHDRDLLGWLAMAACVAISAHGEWFLAQRCGHEDIVAAGLPVSPSTRTRCGP